MSSPLVSRLAVSGNCNRVVLAFPAILFRPEECKFQDRVFRGDWNVHVINSNTRSYGPSIGRMLPFIAGPVQQECRVHLNAQQCGALDGSNLTIEFPNFNRFAFSLASYIAVIHGVDSIEDLAICERSSLTY